MKPRKVFVFILKVLLSTWLVYWIYQSGQINEENILFGLTNWTLASLFLLLTFIQLILGAKRTQSLIQFKSNIRGNFSDVTKISWASSFVCIASPFNIFGDVFRISTLMKLDESTNGDNSFYASIYSKIFSTLSLIIITLISSLFLTNDFFGFGGIRNYSLIFLFILVLAFLFRAKIIKLFFPFLSTLVNKIDNKFLQKRVTNLIDYNYDLLKAPKKVLSVLLLSLIIQLLNTYSLFIIIKFLVPSSTVNAMELFSIIPIGIFIQLLPISYSGLGVGHLAFSKLLSLYGINVGADVFTIYFTLSFLFNLLGVIPFYFIVRSPLKKTLKA